MNQKQKFTLMALMLGLTFLWMQVVLPALSKKYNWKYGADNQTSSSTVNSSTSAATGPTTETAGSATQPLAINVKAATAPTEVVIGSMAYERDKDHPLSAYPLGVSLSNRGASVQSVTLNRYLNQYDQVQPYTFQKPYSVNSPLSAALATRGVTIGGGAMQPLDGVYWESVAPATASAGEKSTASFFVDLNGPDGKPQLRITKTFEVRPKSDKGAGYEMLVTHQFTNLTGQPAKVKLAFNGPTTPKSENSRDVPEVLAGFDGARKTVALEHSPVVSVKSEQPLDVMKMREELLLWSGMSSAYFDAIVRQTDLEGNRAALSHVKAILLNPAETDTTRHAVALDYETPDIDVPANGSAAYALNVYVGPKLREVIKSDYYASYPLSYDETLVLRTTSGIGAVCGFCTWPFLINFLVLLLQGFHFLLHDWGLSIIALVCLVRLMLHPITKKSQISMSGMTKMGPEMERLKARHKDDPDALKKAQVEFYREQGVAPFLGCLPMFLQMPIWIALWSSLQSTFEIRHARFLWGYTWIKDLSQPDRLIHFTNTFRFWKFDVDAINILPVLMAVVFFIQQKYQPQPVAATPEQQQQQKMMKYMSIFLFPLFLYSQPSGLNLYIFTSTLIGIFESKRIRDHIKERDEKEKAGIVLIDGDAPPRGDLGGGAVRRVKTPQQPPKPAGGIAGFMAKLQDMAEQAKQVKAEQERKAKKGKR
jgi:YidC/Oxa1 family membrane protein insertase